MTLLDRPGSATYARPVPKRAPGRLRTWARDLGLGVRFAAAGGREGWIRTLLTAVGSGSVSRCSSSPRPCRS